MKRAAGAIGLVGFACVAAWVHAHSAFDHLALFDLGILLDGVARTLDGEVFGADFIAPYGPLRYWLVAAVFAVTGVSLAAWTWTAIVLQAGAATALVHFTARVARWEGALLAGVLATMMHGAFHKVFLFVGIVAGWLAFRAALEHRRPLWAGLALAAAAGCRYDAGAFAALALLLGACVAPRSAWRSVLITGVVAATSTTIVAVVLLGAGLDLADWMSLTLQRIGVQEQISFPFPWPRRDGAWAPVGALARFATLAGAIAVHVATVVSVIHRRRRDGASTRLAFLAANAVFGLLLLNQARLIPSANHLFQALPPAFLGLAALTASPARGRAWVAVPVAVTVAAACWIHHASWGAYPSVWSSRIDGARTMEGVVAGLRLTPREAVELDSTMRTLQELTPPGQSLGVGPACALFGVLIDRPIAAPFAEPSYYYRNPERIAQMIDALERQRPPAFVHDRMPTATFRLEDEAPALLRYVTSHYDVVATYGRYIVYGRRGRGRAQPR